MDATQFTIFLHLLMFSEYAYVSPDAKKLYVLNADRDGLLVFEGDFSNATEESINEHIQKTLTSRLN